MTIFENDIKLLESERLNDNPDGGGRLTGAEVPDNEANNLFPDISELDRTTGRVQLRKAYLAVLSPNTDTYFGSHAIVDVPPTDPNVHTTLFDTGSWTDQRADARDRLESYVVAGPESPMYLFGKQLEGQQTMRALQRLDSPLPEVGDVYALRVEGDTNEADEGDQQFVRVTAVNDNERTFEDERGTFTRRELILELSEPLRQDFPGGPAVRNTSEVDSPTVLREGQVADAARYYSIQRVEGAANAGELNVKIPSLFVPLVPSTSAEEAITDRRGVGDVSVSVETGDTTVEVPDVAQTDRVEVELANRGFTYVRSLIPRPRPQTLQIYYRAQGRWERLEDEGGGNIRGSGSGQVDYDTGSVQATLDALPDVPSTILFVWGANASHFVDGSDRDDIEVEQPRYTVELDKEAEPGSVTVAYVSDGTTYTLTDDGDGNLSGDGEGIVVYIRREYTLDGEDATIEPFVRFRPDHIPDAGSQIQVTADEPASTLESFSGLSPDSNGEVQFTLGNPAKPGALQITWNVQRSEEWANTRTRRQRSIS